MAIDDHILNHKAHLVFTNRESPKIKFIKPSYQKWNSGFKFAISSVNNKKFRKNNFKNENGKIRILFHSGGTENFESFEKFIFFTFKYFNNRKKVDICVLSLSKKTKIFFKYLSKKYKINHKINFISYKKNLSDSLRKFTIICGPLGTTTFETIISNSFPVTFLNNSYVQDPFSSWLKNGHLMNLDKFEIKKEKVVLGTWDLIFKNFYKLKKILQLNSKNLDGKANLRITNEIINLDNSKKVFSKENLKQNKFEIKLCKLSDMRNYLNVRNQINNRKESLSKKKIIWPDHVSWFLNNKIKKYKVLLNNNPIIFFWYRQEKDNFGKIVFTGFMVEEKLENKLPYIYKAQIFLKKLIKKKFKDAVWIIFNKKNNIVFDRFNKTMGFKEIKDKNFKRLRNIIKFNSENFNIREIKI